MTEREHHPGESRLGVPIAKRLADPLRPGALERIWKGVDARVREPRGLLGHRGFRLALGIAVVCSAVVVLFASEALWRPSKEPLPLADGTAFSGLEAGAGEASRSVEFADGSEVKVLAGARVSKVAMTETQVVLFLKRGRADFSVVPGGKRGWVIEAQLGRVEVVGTEFSMNAKAESLEVSVARGKVSVRSPWLEGGVGGGKRTLSVGQKLLIKKPDAAPVAPSAKPAGLGASIDAGLRPAPLALETEPSTSAADASETTGHRAGNEASLGAVSELMLQADEARIARQFSRAEALLSRIVREHPRDARAPLAAFSRGVLLLQQLGQPRQARDAFKTALALGTSRSLREDCYLRWLEAELKLGNERRAQEIATQYNAEFPEGRHKKEITRLLDSTQHVQ